ncbi:lysophospholipid acyltransferase family protein [Fusibacter sp. JL298sf-3]
MKKWLYTVCRKGAHFYYRLFYKLRVEGMEHFDPNGHYCICANHMDWRDPIVIGGIIPKPMRFMAKKELFRFKIVAWFLSSIGVFPVDREANDLKAIKNALKVLKEGGNLALFPEGTRNSGNVPLPVKSGVVMMALRTETPILPISISGSFKKFKPLYVTIHPPMTLEAYRGQKVPQETMDTLAKELMLQIYAKRNTESLDKPKEI